MILISVLAGSAIVALFLYSILPIVRNTITGLRSIDPVEKSRCVNWFRRAPANAGFILAMPAILSGIKTAAVISIGTATLAAFIGAGGLGEPIVTGLALMTHFDFQSYWWQF